jgi:hypothetical protein
MRIPTSSSSLFGTNASWSSRKRARPRREAALSTLGIRSLAAMSGKSTETEVLAQELDTLGNQLRAVETRLAEVEKIIEGLEAAALSTARALEEVSSHWDKVYRAMRRAE